MNKSMKKSTYFVGMAIMVVLYFLVLPYLWEIIHILFLKKGVGIISQLTMYKWVAVGAIGYTMLHKFVRKNIIFVETFSHEATHTFFAFLFGRQIKSFQAGEGFGAIVHSGSDTYSLVPIALAPYCFPLIMWWLLPWRCFIIGSGVWLFDIFIGVSLAFHVFCFYSQIGNHQTDINQYPLHFSYMYIVLSWIINICIISVAFFPNMNDNRHYGMFSSILRFVTTMWENAECLLNFL